MSDPDVLVIGAGISGLSVAGLLARKGVSVEVWEQSDHPGGKIQTRQQSGYLLEESASMVLNFRPEVNRFLATTQLDRHRVKRAHTEHRYLLRDGQLVGLPLTLRAMARSQVWGTSGKLRLLLEPFAGSGDSERETVTEFITRRLGRELLERAIEPFVAGPLASDPDRANAATTLPRLTGLEQRYGSITWGMLSNKLWRRRTATETEAFSFDGGMKRLIDVLGGSRNIRLRTDCGATELVPVKNGWIAVGLLSGKHHTLMARHIILCTPAQAAASLVAPLDVELGTLLGEIQYAPVSVVHMGFAG
ncbi:MAG: protoporphyrinogen oxidase, partial [Arenicellales bacterium]|nr:protoporphyrinogen oxidase [Arenicellales bacterium]